MPMGGSVNSGFSGGGAGSVAGIGGLGGGSSFLDSLKSFFSGGQGGFSNAMDLGSLALNAYGLNQSLGIQDDQLGILKNQDKRAARADNTNFENQQFMAAQLNGSLAGLTPEEIVASQAKG